MRCFTAILAAALAVGVAGACAGDPTVAWYRFEDGQVGDVVSGNAQVMDSGPNGLHGWTPYGCHAQRVAGLAPGSERAWDISGLDDWFLVPDDPRLAGDGSLTLEAWIKIRGYQHTAVANFIVFRGDSTPGRDAYCLSISPPGNLVFHIEGPGGRQGEPVATVKHPFTWFDTAIHVAGVFDAQTGCLGLYVNGDRMDSTTTRVRPRVHLNPAMGPGVGVGGYHGGGKSSFAIDGAIDEVRISGAALDPAAFLCGDLPTIRWMGTKGFEQDGVEPDCGRPDTSFLFAVRCVMAGGARLPLKLELRRDGRRLAPIAMTRARGLPQDDAGVYRARVELGAGKWEYRFVADMAKGAPMSWHSGPVVTGADHD